MLVRHMSKKLNKKMYSKLFSAFTDDLEGNVFNKFAREIKDKRNYLELCKLSHRLVLQNKTLRTKCSATFSTVKIEK
jgi:hypothetical protein